VSILASAVTQESRDLAHAITRAYVASLVALFVSEVVVIGLASRRVRGGGPSVVRNWRFWLGAACVAAAAVVGIVGYLQLSTEPRVNHQLPYLASAGMAVVILSVLGGSLIVAAQVRTDESQLAELEAAVQALATAVAPAIESPARRAGTAAETGYG
jgi:hypothetical protein